jgi:hypothetical protein
MFYFPVLAWKVGNKQGTNHGTVRRRNRKPLSARCENGPPDIDSAEP